METSFHNVRVNYFASENDYVNVLTAW